MKFFYKPSTTSKVFKQIWRFLIQLCWGIKLRLDRFGSKETRVIDQVKTIFPLVDCNPYFEMINFNAKEIFQLAKSFDFELIIQNLLDYFKFIKGTFYKDHIIHINQNNYERGILGECEQLMVKRILLVPLT